LIFENGIYFANKHGMKVDENRKSAILDSLLKQETAHLKDLPETDALISKSKETFDKLELSTKKGVVDRVKDKTRMPPVLQKEHERLNWADKVELSTKKKLHNIVKSDGKPATIITQDRIDALLGTIHSETYNARLETAAGSSGRSQLLDIVV
jgi:hypothetical protein